MLYDCEELLELGTMEATRDSSQRNHLHPTTAFLCQFLFCVACAAQLAGHPQGSPACKGPRELDADIARNPSAAAYDALGAYFGVHKQPACATNEFRKAVRLDPKFAEAHYDLGLSLLNTGSLKEAVEELEAAVRLSPSLAQTHTALAMALDKQGQPDAAVREFERALQIDPRSVPALDGIGKSLIAENRDQEAINYLKDAPKDEGLELDLASAYSAAGDINAALRTLQSLVSERSGSMQAHLDLGIVYEQQDRYRNAVEEFRTAVQLDPADDKARTSLLRALIVLGDFASAEPLSKSYFRRKGNFEATFLLAEVERGLGNYSRALVLYRQSIRLSPRDFPSRYGLGFVLLKLGERQEAVQQLQKALQIKPDSVEAHFQLAAAYRSLGQTSEAASELNLVQQQRHEVLQANVAGLKANDANRLLKNGDAKQAAELYREALADDPRNAHTYYNLALALEQLADYSAERNALESALGIDPNLAQAHNLLGLLHLEAGENVPAEQQLQTAISLDPDLAEAHRNLGVLYGQIGKPEQAEKSFRQAIKSDPKYEQPYIDLALLLTSLSRLDEAEQELSTVIGMDAGNTPALTAHGKLLIQMNRREGAIADFRKVLLLSPESSEAHMNLGIALADRPDLEGALTEFSDAVRLAPREAVPHYNRGRVLYDLNRYDEAKHELEAAVGFDPSIGDAFYLLAMIEQQAGDQDAAESLLRKAVSLMPGNSVAVYMLGQALVYRGDSAGAVKCWRKAIALNPDYTEAYYNLARATARSAPEESKIFLNRFQELQDKLHNNDRAEALGSLALASAARKDWPQAIAQLKQAIQVCADCAALPVLRKDLGIVYCQSGDWKNGMAELLEAQKLAPEDAEISQSIRVAKNELK